MDDAFNVLVNGRPVNILLAAAREGITNSQKDIQTLALYAVTPEGPLVAEMNVRPEVAAPLLDVFFQNGSGDPDAGPENKPVFMLEKPDGNGRMAVRALPELYLASAVCDIRSAPDGKPLRIGEAVSGLVMADTPQAAAERVRNELPGLTRRKGLLIEILDVCTVLQASELLDDGLFRPSFVLSG